jgi:transcription antitermination factor NusG
MAHSYTPGLKVAPRTQLRKERRLPLKGDIQVKVGQQVAAAQVVARTELPGKVYPVNAANQLGVSPDRLSEYLTVKVGDTVEKGKVAGKTPGFFGLFGSEFLPPASGVVESISAVTGQLIVRAHNIPVEVSAYVDGVVDELLADEGVAIRSVGAMVQGIFGLGGEVLAPLRMVVDSPDIEVLPTDLPSDCAGQALVAGRFASATTVARAIELGASALIVGGFDYKEIKDILGYEVGVAITGGEDFGLTLVVTEGFGHIAMSRAAFELFGQLEGRMASINGATQIRAGVIRPEVIVTDSEHIADPPRGAGEPAGTVVGDTVRIIRAPWFGSIGTVVDLPPEPIRIESGARVRVMRVQLEDGQVQSVPRANVENLERR